MPNLPKGNKGLKRKLLQQALTANKEMKRAMIAASDAIDRMNQEQVALRRILISERAQVIYYSDKYLACLRKECFDLSGINFLDLDESLQEPYVKQAIRELSEAQGLVPHDKESGEAGEQASTVAKKLILPNQENR